jgi:hypothetical protein
MLASLYNGNVHVWNTETQTLVKSFEVCDLPVRCARFVARKSWIVVGSDDMQVYLYKALLERKILFKGVIISINLPCSNKTPLFYNCFLFRLSRYGYLITTPSKELQRLKLIQIIFALLLFIQHSHSF